MSSQMQQCNKINVIIFADLIEDKKLLTEDQVIYICVRKKVSTARKLLIKTTL